MENGLVFSGTVKEMVNFGGKWPVFHMLIKFLLISLHFLLICFPMCLVWSDFLVMVFDPLQLIIAKIFSFLGQSMKIVALSC